MDVGKPVNIGPALAPQIRPLVLAEPDEIPNAVRRVFLATRRDVGIGKDAFIRKIIVILVTRLVHRSPIATCFRRPERENALITLAQTTVEWCHPTPSRPGIEVRKPIAVPEAHQIATGRPETTHMPLIIGNIIDANVLQLGLHRNRREPTHKTHDPAAHPSKTPRLTTHSVTFAPRTPLSRLSHPSQHPEGPVRDNSMPPSGAGSVRREPWKRTPKPSRKARKPHPPPSLPASVGSIPRSTPYAQRSGIGPQQALEAITKIPSAQRESPILPRASSARAGPIPRSISTLAQEQREPLTPRAPCQIGASL